MDAKAKPIEAKRRAQQEAQCATKAAARADRGKILALPGRAVRQSPEKKETPAIASSDSVVASHCTQFDVKSQVDKNTAQHECGSRLIPDHVKSTMHPAIYEFGVKYLAGKISGGNARCIAMLRAFQGAIRDYSTPTDKNLVQDLPAKIGSYVSFLTRCKPLSIRMGNAIRFLKSHLSQVMGLSLSESETKFTLCQEIDCFINDKIIFADKVIASHAATNIRDGDVLLTYGYSNVVEMTLLHAHELGKQFRVVIVESRPQQESQLLLRLQAKGLTCTYTCTNALFTIMHQVTRVFLGAASVCSNGTVYSVVGTTCVAMVANAFCVPVFICCESYKFHERAQLNSICSNKLGDPDDIAKVSRSDLNLKYDATPSDYISMIVTDYGMVLPTSMPAIVGISQRALVN